MLIGNNGVFRTLRRHTWLETHEFGHFDISNPDIQSEIWLSKSSIQAMPCGLAVAEVSRMWVAIDPSDLQHVASFGPMGSLEFQAQ